MNNQLNQEQREAVEIIDGPVLVLAGAGSGKTRVVTLRIAHLLELGVPPSAILGLTFTNKAANEMKERVHQLTQSSVLICTFHSLGAKILRESIHYLNYRRDFTIYDEDDKEKLLKACFQEVVGKEDKQKFKELSGLISQAKNAFPADALLIPSDWKGVFTPIQNMYQAKLHSYNALDYDDLLALPVRLFREHPEVLAAYQQRWRYLLIDEYQDTNALQYALVNNLVARHHNLCVVGDPDQSIYSWRGANIHNILNFEQDYPGAKVIRLEQNYRSHSNILDAANALIARNTQRYDKRLWSAKGPGEKIKMYMVDHERAEAQIVAERILQHRGQGISCRQMVIFYRTNAQSRVFEDIFRHHRIPYTIVGGISFYQRREIKDVLAWLRLLVSDTDYLAFARTINLPKRGLGDTSIAKLRLAAESAGLSILNFCEQLITDEKAVPKIKLTTTQRKGLEEYIQIIQKLRLEKESLTLAELVQKTIDRTQYFKHLEEEKETLVDRKENLFALVAKAAEWEQSTDKPELYPNNLKNWNLDSAKAPGFDLPKSTPYDNTGSILEVESRELSLEPKTNFSSCLGITSFLEELSLYSSLDQANEADCVNLMTIHNGKGLEFAVTFLTGMEEDLFPHINSKGSEDAVEEERRLCYVGMTRAKEYLYLTHVITRMLWGTVRLQRKSRFLDEIPRIYLKM